jgi:hypothetical protein
MDARQNLLSRVRINRAQRVVQDVDVCILVHSTRKADPLLLATCRRERKRAFLEFSLRLSRACLGKKITFIYKWRKKPVFLTGQVDACTDTHTHERVRSLQATHRPIFKH